VLACHPGEPGKLIFKRLVAKSGDTIAAPLPYHTGNGCHVERHVTVQPGHVWLVGDNLAGSRDSRKFGCVPSQLLVGRPVVLVRRNFHVEIHDICPFLPLNA
jgi:mitochondrial inner membrane protease subunit 1